MADQDQVLGQERTAQLQALTSMGAIQTAADARQATDALAFVQSVRRAVERARDEVLGPMRDRLAAMREQYVTAIERVAAAEARVKAALLDWRQRQDADRAAAAERAARVEVEMAAAEARQDAIEAGMPPAVADVAARAAAAAAAALPAIGPAPVPRTVRGDAGSASVRVDWVPVLEDPALVPREFLTVDMAAVARVVRAAAGRVVIPGIRVERRETIVGRRR